MTRYSTSLKGVWDRRINVFSCQTEPCAPPHSSCFSSNSLFHTIAIRMKTHRVTGREPSSSPPTWIRQDTWWEVTDVTPALRTWSRMFCWGSCACDQLINRRHNAVQSGRNFTEFWRDRRVCRNLKSRSSGMWRRVHLCIDKNAHGLKAHERVMFSFTAKRPSDIRIYQFSANITVARFLILTPMLKKSQTFCSTFIIMVKLGHEDGGTALSETSILHCQQTGFSIP